MPLHTTRLSFPPLHVHSRLTDGIVGPAGGLPETCTRPPRYHKMSWGCAGQSQDPTAALPQLQCVALAKVDEMGLHGVPATPCALGEASERAGRTPAQQYALAMCCSGDAAHVQQAAAAVVDLGQHDHGHVFAHGFLNGAHVIQQLEPVLPSQHLRQALQMPAASPCVSSRQYLVWAWSRALALNLNEGALEMRHGPHGMAGMQIMLSLPAVCSSMLTHQSCKAPLQHMTTAGHLDTHAFQRLDVSVIRSVLAWPDAPQACEMAQTSAWGPPPTAVHPTNY